MNSLKAALIVVLCAPAPLLAAGTTWTISGPDGEPINLCVVDADAGETHNFAAGSAEQFGYIESRGAIVDFADAYLNWRQTESDILARGEVGWEVLGAADPTLNGEALVTRHDLAPTFGGRYKPVSNEAPIPIVNGLGVAREGDITITGTRVKDCG